MTENLKLLLTQRLNFVLGRGQEVLATQRSGNMNNSKYIDSGIFYGFRSAGLSFLCSTLGVNNSYYIEFDRSTKRSGYYELLQGIEILKSLQFEIENDWLSTFKGLISAEIFTDFIEMAEHLLETKYKDPAAVIIGSVLEEHLRQLCQKHGIKMFLAKADKSIPKKADRLNSDLASADIYNKLEQKSVTAWLDLRNKAAHGKYKEYDINQVNEMYRGVCDFLIRNSV